MLPDGGAAMARGARDSPPVLAAVPVLCGGLSSRELLEGSVKGVELLPLALFNIAGLRVPVEVSRGAQVRVRLEQRG